jgi:hypothetical protein
MVEVTFWRAVSTSVTSDESSSSRAKTPSNAPLQIAASNRRASPLASGYTTTAEEAEGAGEPAGTQHSRTTISCNTSSVSSDSSLVAASAGERVAFVARTSTAAARASKVSLSLLNTERWPCGAAESVCKSSACSHTAKTRASCWPTSISRPVGARRGIRGRASASTNSTAGTASRSRSARAIASYKCPYEGRRTKGEGGGTMRRREANML